MSKPPRDNFYPYFYSFDIENLKDKRAIRYSMPFKAHKAIKDAQDKLHKNKNNDDNEKNSNADIAGLAVALAWAAPCVDLITFEAVDGRNYEKTLCLWMIDPPDTISTEDLKNQLERAIWIWLNCRLPIKEANEVINILENGAVTAGRGMTVFPIDSALMPGACARPKDARMYDLLTLYAARQLEGRIINEDKEAQGQLILTGPENTLYSGKQLLRYRPSSIIKTNKTNYWSEIFNVAAVSTPEKNDLRIAVSVSIRNFANIGVDKLHGSNTRHADVFLTKNIDVLSDNTRPRCIDLSLKKDHFGDNPKTNHERAVFKHIMELAGVRDMPADLGLNTVSHDQFSLYPRLGSYHKDKYLAAGTGIPNPEREAYLHFLDSSLVRAGFSRIKFQKCNFKRLTKAKLEELKVGAPLRESIAIANTGFPGNFRMTHFVNSEQDGELALKCLIELLGEPQKKALLNESRSSDRKEFELQYENGFKLIYERAPAGYMAEKITDIDKAKLEEHNNVSDSQKKSIKQKLEKEAQETTVSKLMAHITDYAPSDGSLWGGLVDMPSAIRDEINRDPYNLIYESLAKKGATCQVVLSEDNEDTLKEKYTMAWRDLLRSCGVSPFIENKTRIAGWWILKRQDKRSGAKCGRLKSITTPLYMDNIGGKIRVCILNKSGQQEWVSYSEALIRIARRVVFDLSELKSTAEQSAKVECFFASATPDDDINTVVFCEATNIRSFVKGLGNDALKFDELRLGAVGGAAPDRILTSGKSISLVRISNEPIKSPCYWVDAKQGIAQGYFIETGGENVFWLNRGLIYILQIAYSRTKNKISRHDEQNSYRFADRKFPSISEVTTILKGKEMSIDELCSITRKTMARHLAAKGGDEFLLPFPLHELAKIK